MSLDNYAPNLSRPTTVEQIATALGVATDIFQAIVDTDDPTKLYRKHLIPKKVPESLPPVSVEDSSGIVVLSLPPHDLSHYRIVWEPWSNVVKLAHRSAAQALGRYLSRPGSGFPHPSAFGYIKGRSTRKNAQQHVGAPLLLSADIQNFFPSISTARVELALYQAGIRPEVAGSLARFLCIDGALPLGLSASPLIANLVAQPLDVDLLALAEKSNCRYTRYADDLTFSGTTDLPSREDLEAVLKKHRFKLNKRKFRLSKRGQKHYITGLSVSDHESPHVPKKMKRHLRRELHFIDKFGIDHHLSKLKSHRTRQHQINRIDGTVSYVASIEPRLAPKLREAWARICEREQIERSFEPRPLVNLRRANWFVDETEIEKSDGTRLLALCLVDVLESDRLENDLVRLATEEAGDAFGSTSGTEMVEKGLHWADATWSQREKMVVLLSTAPIRAMVALEEIGSNDYCDVYLRLLRRLLDTALKTADDAVVSIVVESNSSKVPAHRINSTVGDVYLQLESQNQRRPLECPSVSVESKGSRPGMCIPDVLLGAFSRYATSKVTAGSTQTLEVTLFERLRNRYSVIFDDQSGTIYHSRNPFRRWQK